MLAASRAAASRLQRLAAGLATAAPRIGDTKVAMSLLEKDSYINYQRIEDTLAVVRDRCVLLFWSARDASPSPHSPPQGSSVP